LADEPTGNLDVENRSEILKLLRKINEKGTSILMATHNEALASRLAYRMIHIRDGRILS
jgi:cell division transport system ATP-binding protein